MPGPDRSDLKPALDMLGKAKRPVLIAGLGVYWCGASVEFVEFAERLGAPVFTTTKCKGLIPEDHPLRAGCIIGGLIERKLVMEADLIITVGLSVAELQTAQRENLPIVVVVFDDKEIGLIRVKQEIKGIPLHGVQLGGIDWEKLAQSFGADGVTVDTEQALSNALKAAVQSKGTTVISVRIDASGYVAQFNALREL